MKKSLIILLSLPLGLFAQGLSQWQKIAAENNLALKAEFEVFQSKMLFAEQAGYLEEPQLNLGYFLKPINTRNGPQVGRIGLRQTFPWFGTLRAQKEAESQAAEAAYQEFLAQRNALFVEVAQVYYKLWTFQEESSIIRRDLRQLKALRSIAQEKFAQGEASLAEVLQIDNRLAELESRLAIIDQEQNHYQRELAVLSQATVKDSLSFPELDTLPNLALAQADSLQPEWQALAARKKRSKAQKRLSQLSAYPNWGIGLDYIMVDPLPGNSAPDNGADAWLPNLSISIPLYQGKYRKAQASAERMVQSLAIKEKALQDEFDLRQSAAQLAHFRALEKWRLYQKQSRNLTQSLRILQTAYANDQADFQDWLTIEEDWLIAQEKSIRAQADLWLAAEKWKYAGNLFPQFEVENNTP